MPLSVEEQAARHASAETTQQVLLQLYFDRGYLRPSASAPGQPAPAPTTRVPAPAAALPPPPPTALLRAVSFVDAHAAEPIGLAEIAATAGLSPRALQATFRRHLGVTPLSHLRAVRMERAHADLVAARPGDGVTVSHVADRWGFSQLGRFARDYKRRYGRSPHQTLDRNRR